MKIINLIEDNCGERGCLYEHGLSFYIETANHKLLLDTGATDAFISNAEKKGIDLTTIDTVIISHGHYDHAGGVLAFTRLNPTAKIYIRRSADGEFYNLKNAEPKYIGMNPEIVGLDQVKLLDGDLRLDGELSLFTGISGKRLLPRGNLTLKRKCGGEFVQDEFEHEQYLVVSEGDRRVLLSGCAHNGILNILDRYRELYGGEPDYVISGFHTTKKEYTPEDDALIELTARELAGMQTVFYTGHCTGDYPMQIFKRIMGDKLIVLHSGDEILNG